MSAEGEQARQFAQRLENLLQNVLPTCDNAFTATPQGKYGKRGKTVYLIQQRDNSGIPLTCDGDEILRLQYSCLCSCKTPQSMLQVDKSDILLATDSGHSPLCHYDYVRSPQSDIPAAHINIHGSNDAATRIMLSCVNGKRSKNRRKQYLDKGLFPTFSSLHFPVGGDRLRPGLEDVLEMAIYEFHIDTQPQWKASLAQSREEYRTAQIKAIVHEFPDLAYDTLIEDGYDLGQRPDRPERSDRDSMLIRY